MKGIVRCAVVTCALVVSNTAIGGEAVLTWTEPTLNEDNTPLTDLTQYEIFSGCQQSGQYDASVVIPAPAITHTVTGLPDSGTCYFAAKAINAQGTASVFSNEASKSFAQLDLPGPVVDTAITWQEHLVGTRDTALATDDWEAHGNGTTLDSTADWQDINSGWGSPTVTDAGDAVVRGSAGNAVLANNGHAVWTGSGSFNDDQWAEVTILTNWNSTAFQTGVLVRASTDTGANRDCYFFLVKHDGNVNKTTVLGKIVNGTITELHSAGKAWADGDTLSLEVEGTTLTGFKNGVSLGGSFVQTDSDLSTGNPGIWAGGNDASTSADDWSAGNFVGGAAVSKLVVLNRNRGM
jgi:hypothetical protein